MTTDDATIKRRDETVDLIVSGHLIRYEDPERTIARMSKGQLIGLLKTAYGSGFEDGYAECDAWRERKATQ